MGRREVQRTTSRTAGANPRDDILTGLATALYPDGSTPEVVDVVRTATFLFGAGQETTAKLLSAALRVLGDRPDIQQQLRDDRSLIPVFIEECLRMDSPVKSVFRMARKSTTLGDTAVPAGTTVMVSPGAANRDPNRFDDPHEFHSTARTFASTSRSAAASTPAPAHRWPASRAGSASNGSWTGWPISRSTTTSTDPPTRARTTTSRRSSCAA